MEGYNSYIFNFDVDKSESWWYLSFQLQCLRGGGGGEGEKRGREGVGGGAWVNFLPGYVPLASHRETFHF